MAIALSLAGPSYSVLPQSEHLSVLSEILVCKGVYFSYDVSSKSKPFISSGAKLKK